MSEEAAVYSLQDSMIARLDTLSQRLDDLADKLEVSLGEPPDGQIDKLAAALAKAQLSIQNAEANTENDFLNSRYANLAAVMTACRRPLAENGLAIVQLPRMTESPDIVELETILMHESGQFVSTVWRMKAKDPLPQTIGTILTYMRRYSVSAICGIAQVDDDANSAMPDPSLYERISAKEADAILIEADKLFENNAEAVVARMLEKVFSTSDRFIDRVTDIPAGQAEAAINLLRNQHKRETEQAAKKQKADTKKPQSDV